MVVYAQPPLDAAEVQQVANNSEGARWSSYGTGESEEEVVFETQKRIPWESLVDRMDDVKRCMEMMDAKHNSTEKNLPRWRR